MLVFSLHIPTPSVIYVISNKYVRNLYKSSFVLFIIYFSRKKKSENDWPPNPIALYTSAFLAPGVKISVKLGHIFFNLNISWPIYTNLIKKTCIYLIEYLEKLHKSLKCTCTAEINMKIWYLYAKNARGRYLLRGR